LFIVHGARLARAKEKLICNTRKKKAGREPGFGACSDELLHARIVWILEQLSELFRYREV
jgi:hypothetical protein